MTFPIRSTVLLTAVVLACGCRERGASAGADPPRAPAASPDSAVASQEVELQGFVRQLRDSAPAALDTFRRHAAFAVQVQLARLGYIGGPFDAAVTPELEAAIRRYERTRGLPERGDPLSRALLTKLESDIARLDDVPQLPRKFVFFQPGYVSAEGAWVAPELAGQWTAVEISCTREPYECRETQGIYERTMGAPTLRLFHEVYRIDSWDSVEVVGTLSYPCTRYLLRINRVQESATKVRSTTSSEERCRHLDRKDLVMRLESGIDLRGREATERSALMDSLFPMTAGARALIHAERGAP